MRVRSAITPDDIVTSRAVRSLVGTASRDSQHHMSFTRPTFVSLASRNFCPGKRRGSFADEAKTPWLDGTFNYKELVRCPPLLSNSTHDITIKIRLVVIQT